MSSIKRAFGKIEVHEFAVVIEICIVMFLFTFASWSGLIANTPGLDDDFALDLKSMGDMMLFGGVITTIITIVHGFLAAFLYWITKKNNEISAKSRKNLTWTIYFASFSKIVLMAYASLTQPKRSIAVKSETVEQYLKDRSIAVVKSAIAQRVFPKNLNSDMLFKQVNEYLDTLSEEDIAKLFKLEETEKEIVQDDNEVVVGPGEIIDRLTNGVVVPCIHEIIQDIVKKWENLHCKDVIPPDIRSALDRLKVLQPTTTLPPEQKLELEQMKEVVAEAEKTMKSTEVNLVPYLLPLVSPLYFSRNDENEGFDDQAEFEALVQAYSPKSVIIWQPENVEELVRDSAEYIPSLDAQVPSFSIEGTYFYLGSVAGIPMLLDLVALDRIQELYHMRIKLSNVHSLKMTALIYIILSLIDKSNRQRDVEERTQITMQQSEFNAEMIQQEWRAGLAEMRADHENPHRTTQPMQEKEHLPGWLFAVIGAIIAATMLLSFNFLGWLPP